MLQRLYGCVQEVCVCETEREGVRDRKRVCEREIGREPVSGCVQVAPCCALIAGCAGWCHACHICIDCIE